MKTPVRLQFSKSITRSATGRTTGARRRVARVTPQWRAAERDRLFSDRAAYALTVGRLSGR